MSESLYDVVVVGAGPSGLATAVPLARAGVRVLLVEKHLSLGSFPKATGLRPRSMEILRSWGLEDEVLARSEPAEVAMAVRPVLAAPGPVVSLGLPTEAQLSGITPSGLAVFPQDQLEALLLADLRGHGAEVRFGTELVGLRCGNEEVAVDLHIRGAERVEVVSARYLVGADGAASMVRDCLGIEVEELGGQGHHLSTLFRADLSPVMPGVPFVLTATVAAGVEGMFVTTGRSGRWFYDFEWHPEAGESLTDWPTDRLTARIRAASGLPDLDLEVLGVFGYDFAAAVARRQQSGPVFLVGDAAHRTTPRGATGMNTGIADGHNLGWKLAWVARGWADASLLDSYAPERAPVGRANAAASVDSRPDRDAEEALRQDFGVCYASGAVVVGHHLAGRRAPHAWVRLGDRSASTLDLFGDHLTVLLGRAADPVPDRPHTRVLRLGQDFTDPDGTFAAAYALGSKEAVLVRPDGYVGWGGLAGGVVEAASVLLGRART